MSIIRSKIMMTRNLRAGAWLVFTFAYTSLFAQLLQMRAYSTGDGLPQSEVISIYQDRAGYLWLGTYENGLARYDGRTFQRITAPHGILDGAIRKIHQDRHGAIWIGTEEGLVRCAYDFSRDDTTISVFTKAHGLPHNFVTSILEDSLGVLWVGTRGGACYWQDSVFVKKISRRSADNNFITALALAPDGSLWMGTAEGVNIWRGDNVRTLTAENALAHNFVRAVLCDRDGVMWIGTRAGLTRVSAQTSRTFDARNGLVDVDITALAQDQRGLLWIGATSGVSKFDPAMLNERSGAASATNHSARNGFAGNKIFSHFDSRHGLTSTRIAALWVDYENNLWIGTWGGGVCKLFGDYIENYSPQNGLPAAQVYGVFEDRRNRIWLGTNGGGLAIVDGDFLSIHNTRNGLPHDVVHALDREPSGALWIGTDGGAVRMASENLIAAPHTWQIFSKARGFADDRINDVYCAPSGEVWLATNTAGAHCYANGKFTALTTANGLPSNTVRAVHRDRQQRLWIATAEGLFLQHGETQKVFRRHDAGLPAEAVYCIFEDQRGNLWFGTRRGGVALYADEKFLAFNTGGGLSNNVVYSISEDRRNRLWFGTNTGVDCFDAEALIKFLTRGSAAPAHEKIAPDFHLTAAHGLADNECNLHAAWLDQGGNLWFGTAGGATKLYPERLPLATPPPRVHIRPLEVDERLQNPQHDLQIRFKTSLALHFRTLSFIDERNTRSQYFLEGLDGDWIGPTTDDHVRYANLPPGQYTFHLRGANAFGVTSKETAQLRFEIMPPFYRRWWFIISSLLAAGGLIYGGHRWRLRQVHQHNVELARAVEEKTHHLKETHQHLANIKESLPVGMLVVNAKRFVEESNRAAAGLFAQEPAELFNQEIHNLLTSETMTRDMVWAAMREEKRANASTPNGKLETISGQSGIELKGMRKDGKHFPCRVHACNIEDERGALRYVILTCEDLSEWQQLEQNYVENQKQLALLDLLAGMGDILNNKLAGVQGYLDLLKNALTMGVARREDSGESTTVNPLEVISWTQNSAGEMNAILRQLIEFGTHITKAQAAPHDLPAMLQALERRWSKFVKLKIPETAAPLWVMVVPQIKAGLDEALRNSYEAEASEVVATIETLTEQSRVRLTLIDNGRGISPDMVRKVFLPFFKTKATAHPGLGLWKLRQLVQQSGGSVEINFVPQGGTQLVIVLPIAAAAPESDDFEALN